MSCHNVRILIISLEVFDVGCKNGPALLFSVSAIDAPERCFLNVARLSRQKKYLTTFRSENILHSEAEREREIGWERKKKRQKRTREKERVQKKWRKRG